MNKLIAFGLAALVSTGAHSAKPSDGGDNTPESQWPITLYCHYEQHVAERDFTITIPEVVEYGDPVISSRTDFTTYGYVSETEYRFNSGSWRISRVNLEGWVGARVWCKLERAF